MQEKYVLHAEERKTNSLKFLSLLFDQNTFMVSIKTRFKKGVYSTIIIKTKMYIVELFVRVE